MVVSVFGSICNHCFYEPQKDVEKRMKSFTWKMFSFFYWMGWVKWYEYDFPTKKWLKQWFWQKD